MVWCLQAKYVDEFRRRLTSGEINPDAIIDMSAKERGDYFKSFLGEEAGAQVTALMESKLLLKNQQRGILTAAKQILAAKDKPLRKDIIDKIDGMKNLLSRGNEEGFFKDLVEKKLGISVTNEEFTKLVDHASEAMKARAEVNEMMAKPGFDYNNMTVEEQKTRMALGMASFNFTNYYNQLLSNATGLDFHENFYFENWWNTFLKVGGFGKAMKASLDTSFLGRQGRKMLTSHPGMYFKQAWEALRVFGKVWVGNSTLPMIYAEGISRRNSLNGLYRAAGLNMTMREEQYPLSVADLIGDNVASKAVGKIPLLNNFIKYLGRAFKSSEDSFKAFSFMTRVNMADYLIDIIEKTHGDIEGEIKAVGTYANTMAGKKSTPLTPEAEKVVNHIIFSPQLVASNWNFLSAGLLSRKMGHFFYKRPDGKKQFSVVRKESATNLLKYTISMAGILLMSSAIDPDSVEEDDRSSDFGQIRARNTRFDISGGMAGLFVLARRIMRWSTKSSTTGIVKPLGSGFFQQNPADLLLTFAGNKLSPMASVIKDVLTQKTFSGERPTLGYELANLFAPITVSNYVEMEGNPPPLVIAAMISDFIGMGTNTYEYKTDWELSESKKIEEFEKFVGEEKFKKANDRFNKEMNDWINVTRNSDKFLKAPMEEQMEMLKNKKIEIRKKIFFDHEFFPGRSK